jgi:hypothetical protein
MSLFKSSRKKIIFLILFLLVWVIILLLAVVNYRRPDTEMKIPLPLAGQEEKIKDLFDQTGLKVTNLVFHDDYWEINLAGNLTVLLKEEADLSDQVASLQFILNRSKIEGKIPSKIDLRFDKPVLKY